MTNLNRLKVVLVEQGKTGKWLAGEIGKSTCTVSKWCSNTVQPDLKTLNDIANILQVDFPNCSANHLPVFCCSTSTTFIRFRFAISS